MSDIVYKLIGYCDTRVGGSVLHDRTFEFEYTFREGYDMCNIVLHFLHTVLPIVN